MPDLSQSPPSRYRVVERDRRLVVIETASGQPVQTDAQPPTGWLPRQAKFDGTAELTTMSFYDDKAPRRLRLDPGSTATLGRFKLVAAVIAFAIVLLAITNIWLLLPLGLILGNSRLRAMIRAAITGWLDRIAQEAG